MSNSSENIDHGHTVRLTLPALLHCSEYHNDFFELADFYIEPHQGVPGHNISNRHQVKDLMKRFSIVGRSIAFEQAVPGDDIWFGTFVEHLACMGEFTKCGI